MDSSGCRDTGHLLSWTGNVLELRGKKQKQKTSIMNEQLVYNALLVWSWNPFQSCCSITNRLRLSVYCCQGRYQILCAQKHTVWLCCECLPHTCFQIDDDGFWTSECFVNLHNFLKIKKGAEHWIGQDLYSTNMAVQGHVHLSTCSPTHYLFLHYCLICMR